MYHFVGVFLFVIFMSIINKKFLVTTLLLCGGLNTHAAVFNTYADEGSVFRSSLNGELAPAAVEQLDKKSRSKDAVLYLLEKGRLLQVNHQYQESADVYKKAFELLDKQNNRAVVSASRMGFKALSMLSNDSIMPYHVPRYEQVLAHVSQAKNYIYLQDTEAAGVEMRIAQRIQREIEQDHQKELEKKTAKDKAKQTNTEDTASAFSALDEAFNGLDPIAGRVKNTYQNAYAFYMAANLWEAIGEYNDALVDYKKSYELQADKYIATDVKRLDQTPAKKGNSVPVIVFIEQGTIPQKIENKIALPLPSGIVNMAFATYEPSTYQVPQSLRVKVGDKAHQSFVLNDIGALAVKELKERTMNMVTSQILRASAKYAVQRELGNQLGPLGQLAGTLMNFASERADLRAWSTLPSNTQISRFELKPGHHTLQVLGKNAKSDVVKLDVKANQTLFVYVNDVNDKITTSISAVSR